MAGVSSRARPYPYSAMIGQDGVMVRDGFIGRKVQSYANSVPTDTNYSSDDLYRERSFAFKAPLGMGESTQQSHVSKRYHYGLNMWFSGNKRGKGPKWNNLAPTTTASIQDFYEALHGGVVTQFIAAGRYMLRRDGDTSGTQVVSKDFVTQGITSAARFKPVGGTDSLFVTLEDGSLWQYDGAAWTGPAAAAGTWNGDAFLCTVVGDQFFIKDSANTTRLATADPMTGTNYSGQHVYGDGSLTINALAEHAQHLVALMDNGEVFGLNEAGGTEPVTSGLATTRAATNGLRPARDVRGSLYVRSGDSWFRLPPAGDVEPIGPERLMANDSEVAGVAQCFAWYGAYYGFWGLWNSSSNSSYLVQFGDWLPGEDEDGFVFVETFNGALVKWAGRRLTAMRQQSIGGVPRLYVGFTDGTYGWIKLPSNTPNPFAPTSGAEFADGGTGDSKCYWPRHTMLKEADTKAFLHVQGYGTLDADDYVTVSYRTNPAASYTPLASLTQSGQREEFDGDTGVLIDIEETFVSGSSASTPVLESLVLREQLRPALRMEWGMKVKARHRVALRNGATDSKTPDQIRAICRRAADMPGATSLTMPDETVSQFHAVNYGEELPADTGPNQRYGLGMDIPMSFVQYRTTEVYGTFARFSALTFGELGSMTFAEAGIY